MNKMIRGGKAERGSLSWCIPRLLNSHVVATEIGLVKDRF